MQHHTKTKGDLGVLKAAADLAARGFVVLWPCTEHAPFDLVVYREGEFSRVQVRYCRARRGRVEVRFSTSYGDARGSHRRALDRSEVDVVCAYCPDTDKCYYLNPREHVASATLRIQPAANSQRRGVCEAQDKTEFPRLAP